MLAGLHARGPVIVVAHSLGAVIARSLAAGHPQLVAGIVLLDGAVDDVILWPGSQPQPRRVSRACHFARL